MLCILMELLITNNILRVEYNLDNLEINEEYE